jgi:hypothetical protein
VVAEEAEEALLYWARRLGGVEGRGVAWCNDGWANLLQWRSCWKIRVGVDGNSVAARWASDVVIVVTAVLLGSSLAVLSSPDDRDQH